MIVLTYNTSQEEVKAMRCSAESWDIVDSSGYDVLDIIEEMIECSKQIGAEYFAEIRIDYTDSYDILECTKFLMVNKNIHDNDVIVMNIPQYSDDRYNEHLIVATNLEFYSRIIIDDGNNKNTLAIYNNTAGIRLLEFLEREDW